MKRNKYYLNSLFWDLEIFIFVNQAENFIKNNLITANVVNIIFSI